MKANTHKYILKSSDGTTCTPNEEHEINVSRSVGSLGSWIGCGFIDKTGQDMDHINFSLPFFSLVYVLKGKGEYVDKNGVRYPLTNGSLLQRPPNVSHTSTVDLSETWHEYYIDLNPEFYSHLTAIRVIDPERPVYQLGESTALYKEFDQLIKTLGQADENELPDIVLGLVSFIRKLTQLADKHQPDSDLDRMIQKSCQDFDRLIDQRIDLKEYCKTNGWGYESFRKNFKAKIGLSPNKYIVRRRLDKASQLLKSTHQSITEISILLGYKSQYEFSNQFKRQFGVFPKHFRGAVISSELA